MKKPNNLFAKIYLGYLVTIAALVILILVFSFRSIRESYISSQSYELSLLNNILSSQIKPLLIDGSHKSLDSLVKHIGSNIEVRITIIDPDGVVLGDSKGDPLKMENHIYRPEIQQAIKNPSGESVRYSSTVREQMLYLAVPIKDKGRLLGYSRLSLYLRDVNKLLDELKSDILNISLLVCFGALLAAFIFSKKITKPIEILANAFRKVSSGDFETRINVKSHDELKDLADNFNNMTARIKELFVQLSSQKEELDAIISSMQDSLVVIDSNGIILFCNKSFENLLQKIDIIGKPYWEVFRSTEFSSIVKKTLKSENAFTNEFVHSDRNYLCSSNYIAAKKEIVLIIYDMTDIRKLEQIKKDIVQNVSHELRTPLTAIKGFVETLEEETEPDKRNYLEIIKRHTDRLINIVQDLLMLSRLEDYKPAIEMTDVDLRIIMDNISRFFSQKINDKNLYLNITFDETTPPIKADAFKLEQMLINLVDNSVKYTDNGGITITVRKAFDQIVMEVKDTGIGIPKEHQERVFERFYTVDRSRSRKLGGTGLGLSIVKHIVMLHKGSIKLESQPGTGTTFTIIFPVNSKILV